MRYVKALVFLFLFAASAYAADVKLDSDLLYRTVYGQAEDIVLLAQQGADPNAVNERGESALMLAAMRKDAEALDILETLKRLGANLNWQDTKGQTALFYGARTNNIPTVKWLLENGAEPYITDQDGNVARNIAFLEGYTELFEYMDGFVNQKREEVLKQHEEYNKALEEKYAAEREQRLEEIARVEEHNRQVKEAREKTREELKREVEEKTQQQREQARVMYSSPQFASLLKKLSYEACSFQYWSFVEKVKMQTEFKQESLNALIEQHKTRITEISEELINEYRADQKYLNGIIRPSQNKIATELLHFGSNATLVSRGIGKQADADTRCESVASEWEIQEIKKKEATSPETPSS